MATGTRRPWTDNDDFVIVAAVMFPGPGRTSEAELLRVAGKVLHRSYEQAFRRLRYLAFIKPHENG